MFILFLFLIYVNLSAGFHTKIENVTYNVIKNYQINNSLEYIIQFEDVLKRDSENDVPPSVWIESDTDVTAPLMIVARQPQEMLSWQLPLIVESESGEREFHYTSRILCHDIVRMNKHLLSPRIKREGPIVSVSTSSNITKSFNISVSNVYDFYIKHSQRYNFTITPSAPRYFYYNYTTNNDSSKHQDSNYETVILEVDSEDDICMTVSIQNVSCPVFDTNQDVTFRGFYETVNKKGGITIPKFKFPYGFYIVFVAKADDLRCNRIPGLNAEDSERIKKISLFIKPSITYSDYVRAVIVTLACIGGFYVVFGLSYIVYSVKGTMPRQMAYVSENFSSPPNSRIVKAEAPSNCIGNTALDNTSIDESEYDVVNEIETDVAMRLGRGNPYLTDLAKKHPKVLTKKSYLYLYNVLTVAVFYGLPVVQLVITYQRVLNETGEQDLCYYNFLCAHPLGLLSDFNHVFSNIAYILLGILFLIITYIRENTHNDINFDKEFGIPQHYGLFYALAVALIMEGVLSGSYHVCPNQMNFQFDSSFMYVMAVLCMIKLYQNRHPDINASAYATFGVLAVAVLLGMIGILEGTVYFWRFFIVIYILTCLYLSIKIYYMGCWRLSTISPRRIYHLCVYDFWSGPVNLLKPCHTARFVLLLLGNISNWTLAGYAFYWQPKNFAVFLLAIFMANTLLYFFFYVVMKYINKERVGLISWICLILSTICAISAMYFFLHKAVAWSRTAAESRQFNMECKILRFYDNHDIWHFLSAIGMFFTFMVLLTLDDDLSHTHHSQIPVF